MVNQFLQVLQQFQSCGGGEGNEMVTGAASGMGCGVENGVARSDKGSI